MTLKEEEVYKKALSKYGFDLQSSMVYEECSELINALCKYHRNRCSKADVITEIADVLIMCEQMSCYFGKEYVEKEKARKLERLKNNLK